MKPEVSSTHRIDVAQQVGFETIGQSKLKLTPDQVPWIDGETVINTSIVDSPNGVFQFGSVVGASEKMQKIVETEMENAPSDDDKLNQIMYTSVQQILGGNPGSVKRVLNAPEGVSVFYGGTKNGARIFFMDGGNDEQGVRTFLKVGVGRSKNVEPKIIGIISGKGRGKEKV